MKIPESLGFWVNYHAKDYLQSLEDKINHRSLSVLARIWNKVVQWIPFVNKYLLIASTQCHGKNKKISEYMIRAGESKTSSPNDEDLHLLSVPHSQQTSPNGCLDACLDMIGNYFNCATLKANVDIRSDGLRRMPDTKRPLLQGMNANELSKKLHSEGLQYIKIGIDANSIKTALRCGPILARIRFAFGFGSHAALVIGYYGDDVIINDPWHGGHITKSMQQLIDGLACQPSSLLLIQKKITKEKQD